MATKLQVEAALAAFYPANGNRAWPRVACDLMEDALEAGQADVKKLVERQANDEGCWFEAQTCAEAYLQQQLRELHAAIEGTDIFGRSDSQQRR